MNILGAKGTKEERSVFRVRGTRKGRGEPLWERP